MVKGAGLVGRCRASTTMRRARIAAGGQRDLPSRLSAIVLVWLLCLLASFPASSVAAASSLPPADRGQALTCPQPQTPAQVCGETAIVDFAALYGVRVPAEQSEEMIRQSGGQPVSFAQLSEQLKKLGIPTRGVAATYLDLVQMNRPVIARVVADGKPHFVVLETVTSGWGRLVTADVARVGARAMIEESYSGYALCYWSEGDTIEAPRPNGASVEPLLSKVPADLRKMGVLPVKVTSVSGRPLTLAALRVPPGWEVSGLAAPKVIDPKGRVTFTVGPAHLPRPAAEGSATAVATPGELVLITDDPVRPQLRISLIPESTQLPPLDVSGDALDFGEGDRDDVLARKRYMLVDYEGSPGSLYVEPSQPWVHCALLREEAYARNPWEKRVHGEVEVQLDGAAPSGPSRVDVLLSVVREGGGEVDERAHLSLTAAIWPEVRAQPKELFLGVVGPRASATASVRISAHPGWTCRLLPRPALPRGLKATIAPPSGGRARVLQITAEGSLLPGGTTEGEVVVLCRGRTSQERVRLRVPYCVYVRK